MTAKIRRWRAPFAIASVVLTALLGAVESVSENSSASENLPVSSFATSISIGGSTYTAIPMGDLGDPANTFWQLFALSGGTSRWRLETPTGVADNGGLVIEGGAPSALTVAFRPSNDLKFTPIAVLGAGSSWSSAGLIPAGLVAAPDAFVGSAKTSYAAVSEGGGAVWRSKSGGTEWAPIGSARSLTAIASGSCRVVGVRALATNSGLPLYTGATCASGDRAGIFEFSDSSWRAVGPKLGALGRHASRAVLTLAASSGSLSAVVATSTSSKTDLLIAHSTSAGASWSTSPTLRLASSASIVSVGSVGAAGGGATSCGAHPTFMARSRLARAVGQCFRSCPVRR